MLLYCIAHDRFCRLDLSGSGGGGPRWQRLASPEAVQTHCRLVVSVDGIYAVDQRGVVERYSVAEVGPVGSRVNGAFNTNYTVSK